MKKLLIKLAYKILKDYNVPYLKIDHLNQSILFYNTIYFIDKILITEEIGSVGTMQIELHKGSDFEVKEV